jgi:DNA-binding NarL/FixJ family response regulator
MSGDAIRVLIVDDHALVRSGLRLMLDAEDGFEVIEEAGSAEEAVRKARLEKPDIVLLDVTMPGRSGLEATPDILEAAPKARILVLSMQDDPHYVREAFAAGASGYLLKEAADADLVQAIREVADGRRYVHPVLGARPPRRTRRRRLQPIRSRSASARCCACSRSATRTRRSRRCSTSPSARRRHTARTSCRSSGSRRAPSSCATPWPRGSSSRTKHPP